MDIKFVCAVNDEEVFEKNIKRSKIFSEDKFIIRRGYINVSKAYNKPVEEDCDLLCYVHQDVFFPDDWENELLKSLKKMDQIDKNWGVLGIAGVRRMHHGREWYGNLIDRGRQWGSSHNLPARVQTLDELLLIRRSKDFLQFDPSIPYKTKLQFDEGIPSNHFYGADICLQAKARGQICYAINAPCHHNSNTPRRLPADFHIASKYVKRKWKLFLPVVTTCAILVE